MGAYNILRGVKKACWDAQRIAFRTSGRTEDALEQFRRLTSKPARDPTLRRAGCSAGSSERSGKAARRARRPSRRAKLLERTPRGGWRSLEFCCFVARQFMARICWVPNALS